MVQINLDEFLLKIMIGMEIKIKMKMCPAVR